MRENDVGGVGGKGEHCVIVVGVMYTRNVQAHRRFHPIGRYAARGIPRFILCCIHVRAAAALRVIKLLTLSVVRSAMRTQTRSRNITTYIYYVLCVYARRPMYNIIIISVVRIMFIITRFYTVRPSNRQRAFYTSFRESDVRCHRTVVVVIRVIL